MDPAPRFLAFVGTDALADGPLATVVAAARAAHAAQPDRRVALYDAATGRALDVDLTTDTPPTLTPPAPGPGRPRLGVVSREVSLLPRHWAWLSAQRGGASAALRRLVDAARKASAGDEEVAAAIDATHRFLWDLAGDLPGFEEATRALFARDLAAFDERTAAWPAGIRAALAVFTAPARPTEEPAPGPPSRPTP
ncbi:MAG: DUF2239 family protein [Myxococcales bacterium]|nr:DUF2239 family protein [Myxococcales bacterium]